MSKIQSTCVCISLSLSKYSIQRKADKNKVSSDAKKEMITFGKKILKSEELQTITNFDAMVYDFLDWQKGRRTLPSEFLKDGIYLIPCELMPEVEIKLKRFEKERAILVEKFIDSFERRISEAEKLLGDQFNWSDYPEYDRFEIDPDKKLNREVLRNKFKMKCTPLLLNVPDSLKEVDIVLYEQQKEKIREKCIQAEKEIVALLRKETVNFINGLVDRLKSNNDGTRKPLHKSYFNKMWDFLDSFQSRNIGDDADLAASIGHLKILLSSNKVDDIQDDQGLRDELRKQFEEAKNVIESFSDNSLDSLGDLLPMDDEESLVAA